MHTITTSEDFHVAIGVSATFSEETISQIRVKQFGNITRDWNIHNHSSTKHFANPAIQGSFLLALFGGFHQEICRPEGREPICVEESFRCSYPIFVNQLFTPVLRIKTVEEEGSDIRVLWSYEIFCNNVRHFRAKILYWYKLL